MVQTCNFTIPHQVKQLILLLGQSVLVNIFAYNVENCALMEACQPVQIWEGEPYSSKISHGPMPEKDKQLDRVFVQFSVIC